MNNKNLSPRAILDPKDIDETLANEYEKSYEGKGRWGIKRGGCKKAKWQSSCVEMKTMIFVLLFVSSISAKILETIAIEFECMYHERGRGGGQVK